MQASFITLKLPKENQKNTYSETPSTQEIIVDDNQNCKEDLYLEEIPTQELSEVEIVKKSDRPNFAATLPPLFDP